MRLTSLILVACAVPATAVADDEACRTAVASPKRDFATDEACLAHDPLLVATFGVGIGGNGLSSADTEQSPWNGFGSLDVALGPVRVSARGRYYKIGSAVDALVGYRIGGSYDVADITWATSRFVSETSTSTTYAINSYGARSLVRTETVLVAGVRGLVAPGGTDFKALQFGVQHFTASGFHTHRRWEVRGVLRGTRPGVIGVYDNAIPSSGHLVGGLEVGYVPYSAGSPAMDQYETYVAFDLGWSFEL